MFRQQMYEELLGRLSDGAAPTSEDREILAELLAFIREDDSMSTGEAAEYFHVGSINTIKRWIDRGLLPAYDRAGASRIPLPAAAQLRATFLATERSNADQDYMPRFNPRVPKRIRTLVPAR